MADFWRRLRQRKLVQWALAYAAGAFALLQGVDIVAQQFGWPEGLQRGITLVLVLGFFATLVLAWYHGERGAQTISGAELLVLTLLLAVGGGLLWRFAGTPAAPVLAHSDPTVSASDPAAVAPPAKSIAVLPFASLSADQDNAYFADGLSVEIINSLSRVPDLRVAARTSSFALRNSKDTVPQIAARLHVATVLEGTVRRGGDRLRISAQLIRAADGFELWSQTYDRGSADVIVIQEDVARQIAQALKTAMDPEALAEMQRVGTRSVPAYQAYLNGLARMGQATARGDIAEGKLEAQAAFDLAIALDPQFMDAYAASANLQLSSLNPTVLGSPEVGEDYLQRLDRARSDLAHASELARNAAERDYYAALRAAVDLQYVAARQLMAGYLETYPEHAQAVAYLADWALRSGDYLQVRHWVEVLDKRSLQGQTEIPVSLLIWARDYQGAAAIARRRLRSDTVTAIDLYNGHRALLAVGDVSGAAELLPRIMATEVGTVNRFIVKMRQLCAEDRVDAAAQLFTDYRKTSSNMSALWHGLTLLGRRDEAVRLLQPLDHPDRLNALAAWLYYPQFDVTRFPHLNAVLEAQGIHRPPARLPPFACRSSPQP